MTTQMDLTGLLPPETTIERQGVKFGQDRNLAQQNQSPIAVSGIACRSPARFAR